jgi:hypothetical protein
MLLKTHYLSALSNHVDAGLVETGAAKTLERSWRIAERATNDVWR